MGSSVVSIILYLLISPNDMLINDKSGNVGEQKGKSRVWTRRCWTDGFNVRRTLIAEANKYAEGISFPTHNFTCVCVRVCSCLCGCTGASTHFCVLKLTFSLVWASSNTKQWIKGKLGAENAYACFHIYT